MLMVVLLISLMAASFSLLASSRCSQESLAVAFQLRLIVAVGIVPMESKEKTRGGLHHQERAGS
jgi:hypothetical protein